MPIIQDEEFGKITVRRSAAASQIKVRVAPDGTLHASLPRRAPVFLLKGLIKTSRLELRKMLQASKPEYTYTNGMQIGKSHTLIINRYDCESLSVTRHGQQIIVKCPNDVSIDDPLAARQIREAIILSLRVEAKSYLPRRLSFLAEKHGYKYSKTRFSHSSTRWGSCNSNGTISLNIALMKLPFELIDYVIIHELSHTKFMNHSAEFWNQVSLADPEYKKHRKLLKQKNPSI